MKITNRHGLPDALVRAMEAHLYDGPSPAELTSRRVSVTSLVLPPQMAFLRSQHAEELSIDVSEALWLLLGIGVHRVLQEAGGEGVYEKRLEDSLLGWSISGQIDAYEDGVIADWKVTSVWSVILGGKSDWELQLNLYAWLMRRAGFEVKGLEVRPILRDWQTRDAKVNWKGNYPPIPFALVPVPMWPHATVEAVLTQRLGELERAISNGSFRECSDEETWLKAKTGEHLRCATYCSVSSWCKQFAAKV